MQRIPKTTEGMSIRLRLWSFRLRVLKSCIRFITSRMGEVKLDMDIFVHAESQAGPCFPANA